MKKYLNLGCGYRYHQDWTNVDFVSTGKDVVAHNLLEGIPFEDNYFKVVYHSHVLEHFMKEDAKAFITECYRVLQKDGIIRLVVPDLEQIVREYIKNLEGALQNDEKAKQNYEWIKLEMYDQTVRTKGGGDMAKYLFQENIPNEEYVFERMGQEVKSLREKYLQSKLNLEQQGSGTNTDNLVNKSEQNILQKVKSKVKSIIKHALFGSHEYKQREMYANLGRFRSEGEIHQWMYDRYSIKKLLEECGFENVTIKTAFESDIPNWNDYYLESENGVIYKPDSLFVEAFKL